MNYRSLLMSPLRLVAPIMVAGLFVGSIAFARPIDDSERPGVVSQLTGAGDWESGRDRQGKRGWQLQIKHLDDDSLEGRIHVVGSAAVQEARVEGRVDDDDVYGVLVADDNQQVGTFTGTVFAEGAAGTYTFTNGDTGNWNWSGHGAKALQESQREARLLSDTADLGPADPE